jgi:formylmethanofuran dehydrogenase subunit E
MKNSVINEEVIKKAIDFHGHLGPFLILGLKMGSYAREYIKPNDIHDISAEIRIEPLKTPESCIIDGVQFTSGCTTGKCNLEIKKRDGKGIEATFKGNNKEIIIKVKDMTLGVIRHNLSDHHGSHHSHGTVEDVAHDILHKDFDALFEYEKR